jgi:hypothetical protein
VASDAVPRNPDNVDKWIFIVRPHPGLDKFATRCGQVAINGDYWNVTRVNPTTSVQISFSRLFPEFKLWHPVSMGVPHGGK